MDEFRKKDTHRGRAQGSFSRHQETEKHTSLELEAAERSLNRNRLGNQSANSNHGNNHSANQRPSRAANQGAYEPTNQAGYDAANLGAYDVTNETYGSTSQGVYRIANQITYQATSHTAYEEAEVEKLLETVQADIEAIEYNDLQAAAYAKVKPDTPRCRSPELEFAFRARPNFEMVTAREWDSYCHHVLRPDREKFRMNMERKLDPIQEEPGPGSPDSKPSRKNESRLPVRYQYLKEHGGLAQQKIPCYSHHKKKVESPRASPKVATTKGPTRPGHNETAAKIAQRGKFMNNEFKCQSQVAMDESPWVGQHRSKQAWVLPLGNRNMGKSDSLLRSSFRKADIHSNGSQDRNNKKQQQGVKQKEGFLARKIRRSRCRVEPEPQPTIVDLEYSTEDEPASEIRRPPPVKRATRKASGRGDGGVESTIAAAEAALASDPSTVVMLPTYCKKDHVMEETDGEATTEDSRGSPESLPSYPEPLGYGSFSETSLGTSSTMSIPELPTVQVDSPPYDVACSMDDDEYGDMSDKDKEKMKKRGGKRSHTGAGQERGRFGAIGNMCRRFFGGHRTTPVTVTCNTPEPTLPKDACTSDTYTICVVGSSPPSCGYVGPEFDKWGKPIHEVTSRLSTRSSATPVPSSEVMSTSRINSEDDSQSVTPVHDGSAQKPTGIGRIVNAVAGTRDRLVGAFRRRRVVQPAKPDEEEAENHQDGDK